MVRNRSDKSTSEKAYSPIALPNTGNNKAMTMTTIIAMVKAIAMSRATIKERFSSTLYARLNAFVIALTPFDADRSEEHTSELQSRGHLVCRLLLEKKKNN